MIICFRIKWIALGFKLECAWTKNIITCSTLRNDGPSIGISWREIVFVHWTLVVSIHNHNDSKELHIWGYRHDLTRSQFFALFSIVRILNTLSRMQTRTMENKSQREKSFLLVRFYCAFNLATQHWKFTIHIFHICLCRGYMGVCQANSRQSNRHKTLESHVSCNLLDVESRSRCYVRV